VTESFARYISAIYADRFDSYDGQKLQVSGRALRCSGSPTAWPATWSTSLLVPRHSPS
jgi:hypothetical protein